MLGSVNIDLVFRVPALPGPGETVKSGSFERHHGGKGANQAVAAARLGAQVALVGRVGEDENGAVMREALLREGIDVSALRAVKQPTGIATIVVDAAGENQITVASGANSAFGAEVARDLPLESGGVFVANFEIPEDAVVAGAFAAAEAGMTLLINPAPARELPASLLRLGPILVPNEIEALALTGETDAVAAARVLAARSGAPVVVTLGPQGAVLVQEGEVEHVPAPLLEAVDTTGAGDTFLGALAAELSFGRSLIDAVRFAVAASSLSVRIAGAREGMPTRAEVEAALAESTQ